MSTRLFERTESADPCVIRTVLFSDLVGSTSLVVSLGDQCSSRLWAQHDRIARDLLPLFAGKEIDKSDGFFMLFDRPIDAVGYALAYHDRFAELSKEFGVAVGARVGIHMGEVLLRVNEDIDIARGAKCLEVTGLAVPTAARVMSLAGKGQTLLTGATFDLARRAAVGDQSIPSEVCWMNHGPYEFKGLDGAVPVCEVGRTGVAPLAPPLDSAKARRCFDPTAVQTGTWRPAPRQVVPGSGGWRLQRRLGQGGFGEVWLARHSKQRAARAFKFWFAGDWRRAPKQEMALCQHLVQRLGVRNDIVRVYGHRIDNPPYFLEMEYVREGNLAEWAARQGGIAKVPLDIRLELVAQIAVALAAAHSVGIIHKDIKPTNVLIRHADDEAPTACLTDFGIGQLVVIQTLQANRDTTPGGAAVDLASLATTTTGTNAGTRLYMSPEYMVKGAAIGHQSDIYALGVLLFQMIVGDLSRPLVHGWQKSIDDELLRAAIEDCIAEAPAERLEHADTLAERLRSIGARRQALEAVRRRTRGWKRVGFSMRVLLLTSVLVAHVALGVLLGSRRVQDARAQALGILARFGSDPNVALEATKSASEMVRQYYGEAIAHQLFSSAAVERVTAARAALWADESVEAAFWASSNGGPVWEHGDWMQVCKAHFLNPTPLIPKLAARAEKGTDHEKYIAFCLLGDLAEPDDALAEMCARAAATETHPGVSAAAYWAAGRLWQSLPVRKHGDRSPIEPDGMVMVPIAGLPAMSHANGRNTYTSSRAIEKAHDQGGTRYMSDTIVTWEQLEPFLEGAGRDPILDALRDRLKRIQDVGGERHAYAPVHDVSPTVALAFCQWLTRRARQAGSTATYRLPTLAEWRFVYYDGNRHVLPCDQHAHSGRDAKEHAPDGHQGDFRVAASMPNFFGVFDTHSDLEELCILPNASAGTRPPGRDTTPVTSIENGLGLCGLSDGSSRTPASLPLQLGFRVVREP